MGFSNQRPQPRRVSRVLGGDSSTPPKSAANHPALHEVAGVASEAEEITDTTTQDDEIESAKASGYEQGRQEGFEAGHKEGLEQGYEQGLANARQAIDEHMAQEKAQIEALTSALTQPLKTLKGDIADAVTDAAVQLARVIVNQTVAVDPHALEGIVREILTEAEEANGNGHHLKLIVCPDMRASIESLARGHSVEVVADERLTQGDIRAVMTRDSGDPVNKIEWDATLENRWTAIKKALGLAESQ